MTLRIGSACTGYGGLDLAVESVIGGELAWVAENDPAAAKVLAHRFPGVRNLGDITAADWSQLEPVDILCAGFPCQDLSWAGQGNGIQEGNRSGLWYVIAAAIGVLRPRLVLLENVAAIVARRPGLDAVLASLAGLGFDAEWLCRRASDDGACHGRNRWFCAARPAENAERQSVQRRRITGVLGGAQQAPAGILVERAVPERQRQRDGDTAPDSNQAATQDANGSTSGQRRQPAPGQAESGRPRADAGRSGGALAAADADGRGREDGPQLNGYPLPDTADRHSPGRHPDGHPAAEWGPYRPAIEQWGRTLGRRAPRPTEPGRTGERLNPVFVEWMMGLPAGWVTEVPGLSRNDMLRILGNGVVPQCAAAAYSLLLPAWQGAIKAGEAA